MCKEGANELQNLNIIERKMMLFGMKTSSVLKKMKMCDS